MPEFHIDANDAMPDGRHYSQLDPFTQGYIEAAFFTSTGPDNEAEGLGEACFADIAPDSLDRVIADCKAWREANQADLDEACDNGRINGYDMQRAGNDYWYTRNGHGVGFWDRGLGELGDKLSAACRYCERYLVRGDDGLIYFE